MALAEVAMAAAVGLKAVNAKIRVLITVPVVQLSLAQKKRNYWTQGFRVDC